MDYAEQEEAIAILTDQVNHLEKKNKAMKNYYMAQLENIRNINELYINSNNIFLKVLHTFKKEVSSSYDLILYHTSPYILTTRSETLFNFGD